MNWNLVFGIFAIYGNQVDIIRTHRYRFSFAGERWDYHPQVIIYQSALYCGTQRMASGQEWLSVTQAAEISDYHPEQICELKRERNMIANKFGTVWAVYKTSLLEDLKKNQESGERRAHKSQQ